MDTGSGLSDQLAVETGRLGDGVEDGAVFAYVRVQQFQPLVGLVTVDRQDVIDRDDARRSILALGLKAHLHPAKLELQHRADPLDALEHAGGYRGEKQLGRIEGVRASRKGGVDNQFRLLAGGEAAIGVDPPCVNLVFKHQAAPLSDPVEPSMAPMPCSLEVSDIRSMVASGRFMKAAMRLRR